LSIDLKSLGCLELWILKPFRQAKTAYGCSFRTVSERQGDRVTRKAPDRGPFAAAWGVSDNVVGEGIILCLKATWSGLPNKHTNSLAKTAGVVKRQMAWRRRGKKLIEWSAVSIASYL
jgi:hypothetical protein